MGQNKLVSFLIGLLTTGMIIFGIAGIYFFGTFDLAGGESFQKVTFQNRMLFAISLFLISITSWMSWRCVKGERKSLGLGISIWPLVICLWWGAQYSARFPAPKPLDATIWKQQPWKPLGMAIQLLESQELIGMNRNEVKHLLGEGFENSYDYSLSDRGYVSFHIEKEWTLTILFQHKVVTQTSLRRPRMMT